MCAILDAEYDIAHADTKESKRTLDRHIHTELPPSRTRNEIDADCNRDWRQSRCVYATVAVQCVYVGRACACFPQCRHVRCRTRR
jgi:hypothetical protein